MADGIVGVGFVLAFAGMASVILSSHSADTEQNGEENEWWEDGKVEWRFGQIVYWRLKVVSVEMLALKGLQGFLVKGY